MTTDARVAAIAAVATVVAACSLSLGGGRRITAGPTADVGDAWARHYEEAAPDEPLEISTENPLVETATATPRTPEEEAALRIAVALALRYVARGPILLGIGFTW